MFVNGTIVKEQDVPEIPQYVYHFTDFEAINNGAASPNVLVGNSDFQIMHVSVFVFQDSYILTLFFKKQMSLVSLKM